MSMRAELLRVLLALSRRSDLVLALIVIVAVLMMIIPLPPLAIDMLIALNIAASVLITLVAFYVTRPVELSALPAIILLATLFRLTLTISTTRLILLDGDAGEVVATFGSFVIGGNVAVGLVIFLVITISQFVVITKGAERVAEVAARFSLDALPGKQMAIDNDLRNGDIEQDEARRRRRDLERESQLYGAMDGAMKFVKGDAIAGLVIVLVALIGGLTIGTFQRGMSFGDAASHYSVLTVGDGLVAQIPALLISVAAGMVVTRVASETQRDIGSEIGLQLMREPRALALAALVVASLGFVPGFPTLVFLVLALGLAGGAVLRSGRPSAGSQVTGFEERQHIDPAGPAEPAMAAAPARARYRVTVLLGPELERAIPTELFREQAERIRGEMQAELGVVAPVLERRSDKKLADSQFRLDFEGVPIAQGEIPANSLLLQDERTHLSMLAIPFREGPPLLGRGPSSWIEASHARALTQAGIGFLEPAGALSARIAAALHRHAHYFVGIQETRDLLQQVEADYPDLVAEAGAGVSLQRTADILRRLVEEGVVIANLRLILEALVEWGGRESDPARLADYARIALRRQLCHRHADANRVIPGYMLDPEAEAVLRAGLRDIGGNRILHLSEETATALVGQLHQAMAGLEDVHPVIFTTIELRRHLRELLIRHDLDLPVMAFPELAPEFFIQPLASLTLGAGQSAAPQAPEATRLAGPVADPLS